MRISQIVSELTLHHMSKKKKKKKQEGDDGPVPLIRVAVESKAIVFFKVQIEQRPVIYHNGYTISTDANSTL